MRFPWGRGGVASVNDGINPDEFTLHYLTVDQIICLVSRLGKWALMAKFDVESAYHNVPVHPSDRFLLQMKWCNRYYVDLALPKRSPTWWSGSCPFLSDPGSSSLPRWLHNCGPPESSQCAHNLSTAIAVWGKCVGPLTVLVVLGIEVDSVNQIACLPIEKLSVLKELITLRLTWKWCNRQELEFLIRHLHPAAKVVWPRRTYHAAWLTFYAAFKKEITQSILTGNFTWTSCGGTTFSSTGMGHLAFPRSGPRGGCRQRHLRFAREQPKFQTRSLHGQLKLMILVPTSGGQTTKFPAYFALVK